MGKFVKATDATTLKVGDVIAITTADGAKSLKNAPKDNNRDAVDFDAANPSNDVAYIIVEAGTQANTFALRTKLGYLFAASSSSNYLQTKQEADKDCDWEITINAQGVATIVGKGQFTRNKLQYNQTSDIFSCYSSTQKSVCIYVNVVTQKIETAPTVEIDLDGVVTVTINDSNVKQIVYVVGDKPEAVYDENDKPVIDNGETIKVTAKGDGIYYSASDEVSKTYTEVPVNLLAPTVEIDETSGVVTITPVGDADGNYKDKITGYVYSVLNADKTPIIEKTNITYNKGVELQIENNQWIQVKTIGQRRYKDSQYGEPVQYVQTDTPAPIDTPVVRVDKDGNVSWDETTNLGFSYKIKHENVANYENAVPVAANTYALTDSLIDGDTIQVQALRNPAYPLQQDSLWSEPLTYTAPSQREAEDIPNDFAFTKDGDNVKLAFTAKTGIDYTLSLNNGTETDVASGHTFAIDNYTSISFKVVGTTGAAKDGKGDYSNLIADKTIDLKETYETTFFNSYKISVVRTEISELNLSGTVDSLTNITLPANGTEYTDVTVSWKITEGENETYAYLTADNRLYINPSKASSSFTLKLQAKLSINEPDPTPVEFTIDVVKEDAVKFDFSGQSGNSSAPVYSNVNLDSTLKEICGEHSDFTGVTSSSNIYPYTNNEVGTIRVGQAKNPGKMVLAFTKNVTCIKIKYGPYSSGESNKLTINSIEKTANAIANEMIMLTSPSMTLTVESDKRVCVYSLDVYFSLSDSDKVSQTENALPKTLKASAFNNDETFDAPAKSAFGANIEWKFVATSGDGTITFADNKGTVKSSETKDEETVGTVTATITSGDVTKVVTYNNVTIAAKPAESGTSNVIFDFSGFDANDTNGGNLTTDNFLAKCSDKSLVSNVTLTKAFEAKNHIKIGSSSASGSITITFTKKVKSITISVTKYSSDTGTVSITNCSETITPTSTPTASSHTLSSATQEIKISTSARRCYINSITVEFE